MTPLSMTRRRRIVTASIALGLIAIWALITFWIGPVEIARAHRSESLPFLNDQFSGRDQIPVEQYVAGFQSLAIRLGWILGGLILLAYLALEALSSGPGSRLRRALRDRLSRAQQRNPEWPFWWAVLLAVWLGLITGLAEAAYTVIEQRHQAAVTVIPFAHGWEGLWMAAAVNGTLLALLALVLHAPRLRWRRLPLDRVLVFSLSTVALFGLARRMVPGVHGVAAFLLAAGIGVNVARQLVSRSERWRPLVRRSALWLAVALGGWTLAAHGAAWADERRQVSALPTAEEGSPNVLLIILDTVRARSLSMYGYERLTSPSLDRIGGGGVVFSNAMATSSWTLPSHASLFTGRWAHELSADWESPLDGTYPTLAEWFGERGYATAGFVANTGYCGPDFGLQRGFIHYDARANSFVLTAVSSWLGRAVVGFAFKFMRRGRQLPVRVRASEIREELLGWLAARPGTESGDTRPFFAFLNLFDAHVPYRPPEPFDRRFARPGARYWLSAPGTSYSERARQDLVDTYDSSIAYVDEEVGVLLRELSDRGALDNTILVITSDHGEEFGEHGVWAHGRSLYVPSLHVPLLVVWPGRIPAGRTIEEPVSLRDLPATLTHLVSGREGPTFPGASLARRWSGPEGAGPGSVDGAEPELLARVSLRDFLPQTTPAGRGDVESILVDGLHYIRVTDGGEELYDVWADPWEQSDLGPTDGGAADMRRLAALLSSATSQSGGAASAELPDGGDGPSDDERRN